ncbi:hypothetical protein D9N00_25835 [Pseudomonas syringae pv. actinidiae]|nr:hypothetical protein D9N00_25835 [Pseudomonas syringae pv. actinidiae]
MNALRSLQDTAPELASTIACFWQIAAIVHNCPLGTAAALHSSVLLHHIHRNFRRSVTAILSLFFI